MGGSLRKYLVKLFSKKKLNICMLGLESSGKTTILYKLHLGEVIATCPTIGFNVETVRFKKVNITLWDVSGNPRSRQFWSSYYPGTNGIIFVVDSEDRISIETAKQELFTVLQSEDLRKVPVLVLANKQDLPNAMTVTEILEKLEIFRIKDRAWHLQSTCALSGEGIQQGITRLIEMVNNNRNS